MTPAPWINVVCNGDFGFQAAAEGGGYTWSINSRDNQLTPWSNDPVANRPGECLYVRDEESGDLWSPTFLPVRAASASYVARHGRGYCRFECVAHDIRLELLECVPLGDSIKISRLTVRNTSPYTRRLSVTAYVEWVLGNTRAVSAPHLSTEIEPGDGRHVGAQSMARALWDARRLPRSRRPADFVDRGPARVPRPPWFAGESAGARHRRGAVQNRGRRFRCLRRLADRARYRSRRSGRGPGAARRGRPGCRGPAAHRALPQRRCGGRSSTA